MRHFLILLLVVAANAASAAEQPVSYARDVLPILEIYCVGCHTDGDAAGGLVLETHAALMHGGDSGPAVTAGQPGSSRLLMMASGQVEPTMPPDGAEGPTAEELELLRVWIEQGAAGPDGEMPLQRELRTPKIAPAKDVALPITAVAVSPSDGRRAIARFSRVEIVEADGTPVTVIAEQPGKVNSLQFSRDGSWLLIASGVTGAYGHAAIHETASGDATGQMVGHRDTLYAAVFSPDETRVATAGYDSEIILWDAASGEAIRSFTGHNGAIFDLAFSPDGNVLASACADETVKLWDVASGQRLDTLSQPEAEVFAVAFTPDSRFVVSGSADNRLRAWRFASKRQAKINPIVATRFIDESPLVNLAVTPEGDSVVVVSQAGNVKVVRTDNWRQSAVLEPLGESATGVSFAADGRTALIALMDGRLVAREVPRPSPDSVTASDQLDPVYLDLQPPEPLDEAELREEQPDADGLRVPRGAQITGRIAEPEQADLYHWHARAGEVWALDADPSDGSRLDPIIAVLDEAAEPVLRVRLQAIRDSYFTFRGKDSTQSNDFRLFSWQEMHLNDYLYAAGEVTRLWMHPRGPDSGFNVYPGQGNRWTYFGTSPATHALGEPAYIVRPLTRGQRPTANGLPIFDVYYENDDDPMRRAGKSSRLLFTAPSDGRYTLRITDTRGEGGDAYGYRLSLDAARPSFEPSVSKIGKPILKGTGREFEVRIERHDGFDGPVTFEIEGLPESVTATTPLVVEAGQQSAVGTLWVSENAADFGAPVEPRLVATADVLGRRVERRAGTLGELTLGDPPRVIPSIQPMGAAVAENESWTLKVRRGETVSARVALRRQDGFDAEVGFGKGTAGRNASHGVYIDNIGLNGLLALEGMTEREFFLTADPVAQLGRRPFYLKANVDGGVTTHPIFVEVLPE